MDLKASTIIDGRYEVISALGDGGMGAVYLARELALGRVVALKFLHEDLLVDQDSRNRFQREARICSSLNHRNINGFYRFGFWQDRYPYIVIEYLEGHSLRDLLNKVEAMPWERALAIGRQIADAMQHAHSAGIVHRDLKPNNIMLLEKPSADYVKIVDFGLARLADRVDQKLTQTGALVGSIYYMSPEQCKGQSIDHRSDIYSLGCILYECIAGKPPFSSDNPIGMLHLHATEPVPALSKRVRVPKVVEELIAKSLEKDPVNRFQSMKEIELAMVSAIASKPKPQGSPKDRTFCAILTAGLVILSAITAMIANDTFVELALRHIEINGSLPAVEQFADALTLVGKRNCARTILAASAEKAEGVSKAHFFARSALVCDEPDQTTRFVAAALKTLSNQNGPVDQREIQTATLVLRALPLTKPNGNLVDLLRNACARYSVSTDTLSDSYQAALLYATGKVNPAVLFAAQSSCARAIAIDRPGQSRKLLSVSQAGYEAFAKASQSQKENALWMPAAIDRASAYLCLGQPKNAKFEADKVLRLIQERKQEQYTICRLSEIYWRLHDVDALEDLLRSTPNSPAHDRNELVKYMMVLYYDYDRMPELAELFNETIHSWKQATEEDTVILAECARCMEHLGDRDAAARLRERCLLLNGPRKEDAELYARLIESYAAQGQLQRARALIHKTISVADAPNYVNSCLRHYLRNLYLSSPAKPQNQVEAAMVINTLKKHNLTEYHHYMVCVYCQLFEGVAITQLSAKPTSSEEYAALIQTYMDFRKFDLAGKIIDESLEKADGQSYISTAAQYITAGCKHEPMRAKQLARIIAPKFAQLQDLYSFATNDTAGYTLLNSNEDVRGALSSLTDSTHHKLRAALRFTHADIISLTSVYPCIFQSYLALGQMSKADQVLNEILDFKRDCIRKSQRQGQYFGNLGWFQQPAILRYCLSYVDKIYQSNPARARAVCQAIVYDCGDLQLLEDILNRDEQVHGSLAHDFIVRTIFSQTIPRLKKELALAESAPRRPFLLAKLLLCYRHLEMPDQARIIFLEAASTKNEGAIIECGKFVESIEEQHPDEAIKLWKIIAQNCDLSEEGNRIIWTARHTKWSMERTGADLTHDPFWKARLTSVARELEFGLQKPARQSLRFRQYGLLLQCYVLMDSKADADRVIEQASNLADGDFVDGCHEYVSTFAKEHPKRCYEVLSVLEGKAQTPPQRRQTEALLNRLVGHLSAPRDRT